MLLPLSVSSVRSQISIHPNPGYDCGNSGQIEADLSWMAPPNNHLEVYKNGVTLVAAGGPYGYVHLTGVRNGDRFSLKIANSNYTIAQVTETLFPGDPDHCQ